MWRSLMIAAAVAMAMPAPATAQAMDGIAAVVDDEVITIGQVRRTAALLQDETLRGVFPQCADVAAADPAQTLQAALECLIDSTLVFREVRRFPQLQVRDADVEATLAGIRSAMPTDLDFDSELRRWQLSEDELRDVVWRQLLVVAYVDMRFRAIVQISDEEIAAAWNDELAPDMRARGIPAPPLQDVVDELVRPLLQEREVNRLVQSWISDLRERATIERRFP